MTLQRIIINAFLAFTAGTLIGVGLCLTVKEVEAQEPELEQVTPPGGPQAPSQRVPTAPMTFHLVMMDRDGEAHILAGTELHFEAESDYEHWHVRLVDGDWIVTSQVLEMMASLLKPQPRNTRPKVPVRSNNDQAKAE